MTTAFCAGVWSRLRTLSPPLSFIVGLGLAIAGGFETEAGVYSAGLFIASLVVLLRTGAFD
jgi:hypothetical protein